MKQQFRTELLVGFFVLGAAIALIALALKVSGLTDYGTGSTYDVQASFDNIGSLKTQAPINIAGVKIGQVKSIRLDPVTYRADVTLAIDENHKIPADSSASILTSGLLGAQYIGLTPGFSEVHLKNGGRINVTHSAIILEDLIGQLVFSMKNSKKTTSE